MSSANVTLFWTASIGNKDQAQPFIAKAAELLKKYGVGLDFMPSNLPTSQFSLNWNDPIDCNYDPNSPQLAWIKGRANSIKLRGVCDAAYRDSKPRLPVVFAKILGGFGGWTFTDTGWWPWCIVDPTNPKTPLNVIIHEMGHAALLKHQDKYVSSTNIMSFDPNASEFTSVQLTKLKTGYFLDGTAPAAGWENFTAD